MIKYLFSILTMIMVTTLLVTYFITGEFNILNMHLTAYGFIMAAIGYIIELLKKKEEKEADHLKYILIKHSKEQIEELKNIRAMILKLEDRRRNKD